MAKQKTEKAQVKPIKNNEAGISFTEKHFYYVVIFAFSFLLYFNSVFNDYNMDDELVTQNHRLTSKGISAIPEILSSPYYEDKAGYKYEYRPIVLVSFAIENSIFGDHAGISHFINVILYALLCVLLLSVLRQALKKYNVLFPFLITLLFVAHPVHTEVVASIKNRDEILSLLFGLLSLNFAIRFNEKRKLWYLPVVFLFFLLGIFSKTTIITFVLLIPLTLVLLSDISFTYLMLITATLVVPSVFFARLYSLTQQLGLAFILFAASATLFCFKKPEVISAQIRNAFNGLLFLVKSNEEKTPTERNLDFSSFKNKRSATFLLIILFSLPLLIAGEGVYLGSWWLTCIPLLTIAIAFVLVSDELKLFLITPISLLTTLLLIKFQPHPFTLEVALVIFLGSVILSANKWFRITGIVNYLIYALVMLAINHSYYFVIMVPFLALLNPRTRLLALFSVVVSLGFYAKSVYGLFAGNKFNFLALINLPLIYLGLAFLWKQKSKWSLNVSIVLIPLIAGLYFNTAQYNKTGVASALQKRYYQASSVKATDLTPVQAVRPLVFMELPVDKDDPLTIRIGTAMLILEKYLKLIFMPYPLSFYYGYAAISPVKITEPIPLLSLLTHIILLVVALFYYRKYPMLSFSILFYLLSIAVFSNLAMPIPGMMGDRFLLIPSIGFAIFIAFILSKIFKQDFADKSLQWKTLKQPLKISLAFILAFYSILTFSRNSDWKDRITLFRHDISAVENSAQAQNLLALHLFIASNQESDAIKQKQLREEALPHFERSLEIYPKFLNASFDEARMLDAMRRYDEALIAYKRTTAIDTGFSAPYFNMGIIYQNKGKQAEAAECYEKFLVKHPAQMEVYANLSYAYFKMGQFDQSIAVNKRALAASPGAFDPIVNIAKTYKQMNEKDSALYYFQKALQIRPKDPNLSNIILQLNAGR